MDGEATNWLIGYHYTRPAIFLSNFRGALQLFITSDRCILARPTGELTHKLVIGAEADLIRNIHGIAVVAELDVDELGYLLGKVVQARRINYYHGK